MSHSNSIASRSSQSNKLKDVAVSERKKRTGVNVMSREQPDYGEKSKTKAEEIETLKKEIMKRAPGVSESAARVRAVREVQATYDRANKNQSTVAVGFNIGVKGGVKKKKAASKPFESGMASAAVRQRANLNRRKEAEEKVIKEKELREKAIKDMALREQALKELRDQENIRKKNNRGNVANRVTSLTLETQEKERKKEIEAKAKKDAENKERKEKIEKERIENERAEKERIENERIEDERVEKERIEDEKQAALMNTKQAALMREFRESNLKKEKEKVKKKVSFSDVIDVRALEDEHEIDHSLLKKPSDFSKKNTSSQTSPIRGEAKQTIDEKQSESHDKEQDGNKSTYLDKKDDGEVSQEKYALDEQKQSDQKLEGGGQDEIEKTLTESIDKERILNERKNLEQIKSLFEEKDASSKKKNMLLDKSLSEGDPGPILAHAGNLIKMLTSKILPYGPAF